MTYTVHCGDCLDILRTIPAQSIDAVITDPPYPMIKRDYGMLTEDEWWSLMMGVCAEVRRVLKPTGSAVFILQPNSRKVGSMRGWLWEFMAWVCREWNMVQDVWWWNNNALPTGGATTGGLARQSVKACVWAGNFDCYRNQAGVLDSQEWQSYRSPAQTQAGRLKYEREKHGEARQNRPSGHAVGLRARESSLNRNGSTPFNCLPFGNGSPPELRDRHGHGASTPLKLADWWTRYIVPPGGTVLDPFNGAGTMGVAALQNGAHYIGIEKMQKYVDVSHERLSKVQPMLAGAD